VKLLPAVLASVLLLPEAPPAPVHGAAVTIRVLTYNIHHAEGRDGRIDLARIAAVVQSAGADLVALQEVDRGMARTGGVDQVAELARLLGMHAEFGRAIDLQGGSYGLAVLSRWPIESAENRPLPFSPDHEPRIALTVRLRAGRHGPWLRFTNTHLDNTREPNDRLTQAEALNALLPAVPSEPTLLAGDFNSRPGTDVFQALQAHWTVALPDALPGDSIAPGPGRRGPRGDLVLFRPAEGWRLVESRSLDESVASDHRPVLTVLEWIDDG
jgi:endonuclease/exonuclease/phosphatase family metal-dependent hydrolase